MAQKDKSDSKPSWLKSLKKLMRGTARPGMFHRDKTKYRRKGRRVSKLGKE